MTDNLVSKDAAVEVAAGYRLQWEEAQSCHVLLYPEGMVKLNGSAGEIMSRVEAGKTIEGVVAALKEAFPEADLEQDVIDFFMTAREQGWVTIGES